MWILLWVLTGCGDDSDKSQQMDTDSTENTNNSDTNVDSDTGSPVDTADTASLEDTSLPTDDEEDDSGEETCDSPVYEPNPFASGIVEYVPGPNAGFGQDQLPSIVLGPPLGGGENSGSLDVLTLGDGGSITLSFDIPIVNGDGPDIIVFENPFVGWYETGIVSVSQDGETWYTWDCDFNNESELFPGCAGTSPVLSHPNNCIDARNPNLAGGNSYDLLDLSLESAAFVRIADSNANLSGGFDLDAVVIVHGSLE